MKKTDVLKAKMPYWKSAAAEFKSIKQITAAALLVALAIVIKMFDVYIIPGVLRVSFSYIPIALCSFVTGPLVAIPCGILADVVGVFWRGEQIFFGYTISAMVQSVILALFFYRKETITLPRIMGARACVNLLVNVLMSSAWRYMMAGGEYFFYVFTSGLKNLIMLPFEVIILVIFLRALIPPLKKMKMIPSTTLKIDKTDIILTCVLFALIAVLVVLYFGNYTEINGFVRDLLTK